MGLLPKCAENWRNKCVARAFPQHGKKSPETNLDRTKGGWTTYELIRVTERFFSGVLHPHLLGVRRPNLLLCLGVDSDLKLRETLGVGHLRSTTFILPRRGRVIVVLRTSVPVRRLLLLSR